MCRPYKNLHQRYSYLFRFDHKLTKEAKGKINKIIEAKYVHLWDATSTECINHPGINRITHSAFQQTIVCVAKQRLKIQTCGYIPAIGLCFILFFYRNSCDLHHKITNVKHWKKLKMIAGKRASFQRSSRNHLIIIQLMIDNPVTSFRMLNTWHTPSGLKRASVFLLLPDTHSHTPARPYTTWKINFPSRSSLDDRHDDGNDDDSDDRAICSTLL